MKAEGRLGERGDPRSAMPRFAVGDQVITRVNDHRAQIYNRERWRVEAIDAEGRGVGAGRHRHRQAGRVSMPTTWGG